MNIDIVSIGSAVLDVLLKSVHFTAHSVDGELMLCEIYGGKVEVEEASLTSGGAGTNTAVSFRRQGLQSAVIAEVGRDVPAQIIIDELEHEGVDTSFLIEEHEEKTAMSGILVAANGARSVLTYRGASKMLTPKDIPFDRLASISHIHLSSIGNPDLIRELFLFCKKHAIQLSWNPSGSELEEIVLRSGRSFPHVCSVVFMNELEYEVVEKHFDTVLSMSETVVVTRGKEGGEVWDKGKKMTYQAQPVQAISELGAGDAFAAGFVGARIRGELLEGAIEFAKRNAASVVQHLGSKPGLLRVEA